MASEDLYDMRNSFNMGNYTQVISDSVSLSASPYSSNKADAQALEIGKLYLVARSHIGMRRYSAAIAEVGNSSHSSHKAVTLLAQYLMSESSREKVVAQAKELVDKALEDDHEATPETALMAATCSTILVYAGELNTAFKWLKTWAFALQKRADSAGSNQNTNELNVLRLELHSIIVDVLLRINRSDMAEREITLMCKIDEDAPQTQLWLGIAKINSDSASDALAIFNDLMDKFGSTPFLINLVALAHTALGEHEEALKLLNQSTDTDPDTMINKIVSYKQVKPSHDTKGLLTTLETQFPDHPWVMKYKNLDEMFEVASSLAQAA